jgi:3-dehydrosphinganine reductase
MVIGQDRLALITGGSNGIGLAVARLLAQHGSNVWILARETDKLETALAEIKKNRQRDGQLFGSISVDVSDLSQVNHAMGQLFKDVGVPHLLINSAGVAKPGYFYEAEPETFHWMMDINYFGTVNMIKAVLPGMMARGSGHIVNISSVAGFLGVFGYSAYGASKFAVSGMSDILRAELKPHGIRVSIVFPPDVDTPQLAYESQFRPAETRALIEGFPIMSPEAVADAILKGVARRRYVILPGIMVKGLYWISNPLGSMIRSVIDWLVVRARARKLNS